MYHPSVRLVALFNLNCKVRIFYAGNNVEVYFRITTELKRLANHSCLLAQWKKQMEVVIERNI